MKCGGVGRTLILAHALRWDLYTFRRTPPDLIVHQYSVLLTTAVCRFLYDRGGAYPKFVEGHVTPTLNDMLHSATHTGLANSRGHQPPLANQVFWWPHVAFVHPGHLNDIWTLVGGFPASTSRRCSVAISARARMNTGESFSDSARTTSIPSYRTRFLDNRRTRSIKGSGLPLLLLYHIRGRARIEFRCGRW